MDDFESRMNELQDPSEFYDLIQYEPVDTHEYYLTGITSFEQWWGDKAYRRYGEWFDILKDLIGKR